jgi:hypothetical protein
MTPREIIERARKELASGGFTPGYEPTWHPYYWIGQLRAAEEMVKGDRVRRRDHKQRVRRAAR